MCFRGVGLRGVCVCVCRWDGLYNKCWSREGKKRSLCARRRSKVERSIPPFLRWGAFSLAERPPVLLVRSSVDDVGRRPSADESDTKKVKGIIHTQSVKNATI